MCSVRSSGGRNKLTNCLDLLLLFMIFIYSSFQLPALRETADKDKLLLFLAAAPDFQDNVNFVGTDDTRPIEDPPPPSRGLSLPGKVSLDELSVLHLHTLKFLFGTPWDRGCPQLKIVHNSEQNSLMHVTQKC